MNTALAMRHRNGSGARAPLAFPPGREPSHRTTAPWRAHWQAPSRFLRSLLLLPLLSIISQRILPATHLTSWASRAGDPILLSVGEPVSWALCPLPISPSPAPGPGGGFVRVLLAEVKLGKAPLLPLQ